MAFNKGDKSDSSSQFHEAKNTEKSSDPRRSPWSSASI